MRPISTDSAPRPPSTASARDSTTPAPVRLRRVRPTVVLSAVAAVLVAASCAASPGPPAGSTGPTELAGSPPSAPPPGPASDRGVSAVGGTAPSRIAPDSLSTIQVSGSAEVEVETDQARVTFAVETEAETAQEASRENATRMDAVLAVLRETDLPGLEIETRGYSLQPRYRRPDASGTREIDGFTARNMIAVTIDDPTRAGTVIDVGIGAGANRVASLVFLASDTEEARLQALRDAVASTRREAEVIAEALGMSLGEPLEVTGGGDTGPPPPMPFRMEAATFQDAPTPVEPGSQTVSASVTIRYALRGGER